MSMEIKARDLIAAGWHEGRRLGAALRRARDLEADGLDRDALLARLEQEFPKQLIVALPRHEPAPLAEAIEADNDEEIANVLTFVRNHFGNKADPITPTEVKAVRQASKGRMMLYTTDELLKEHPMK